MILAATVVVVAVFAAALWRLGITSRASEVFAATNAVLATMRDAALDDAERERVVRRAAMRMFSLFGSIAGRSLLAVALSLAPIGAAHLAGAVNAADVLAFMARWDVVLAATGIMVAAYVMGERLWPPFRTTPR